MRNNIFLHDRTLPTPMHEKSRQTEQRRLGILNNSQSCQCYESLQDYHEANEIQAFYVVRHEGNMMLLPLGKDDTSNV